jgi:large subunit ribosomal protein L46
LLDRPLRLVVEKKYGSEWHWDLPMAVWSGDSNKETLRDLAERAVKECCGEGLQVQVMGNAPCGFYRYNFPKKIREETDRRGSKESLIWMNEVTN